MSSSNWNIKIPKVTIIGAGTFGINAANTLAKSYPHYEVTLISKKDFALNLMATHRLVTEGFNPEEVTRPLSSVVAKGVKIVVAKDVLNFDDKSTDIIITNDDDLNIPHDILILATGAKWTHPIATQDFGSDLKSMQNYLDDQIEKLKDAKKVVVAGLGFVGSELAGELGYRFKQQLATGKKQIICVHPSDSVLDEHYKYTIRHSIQRQLEEMNLTLMLHDVALYDESDPRTVILRSSNSVIEDVDVFYNCTGPQPNVPRTNLTDLELSNRGFIKVKKTYQTLKYPNIFAIGDINNIPGKKMVNREEQIQVLKTNVHALLTGSKNVFREFENREKPIGISLGPKAGVGQLTLPVIGVIKLPEFLVVQAKSKYLYTDKLDEVLGKV
ncbi:Aif1 protein [Saccharomycopsis crataegensis]|uniref:Aif1 protein n=1 Tax=Saccharomycopsis crataegensis TaxID=43959 RepID=A0AAV5QFB9_9ASCO|nr:Aif1 protein [Saccharomycopsis crataegensis]